MTSSDEKTSGLRKLVQQSDHFIFRLILVVCVSAGMFWAIMLTDPPTTSASVQQIATGSRCLAAEEAIKPRLNAELVQRRWAGGEGSTYHNHLQHAFEAARIHCRAGRISASLATFQAVSNRLAAHEAYRPISD